jgi:hypothetical protein
MATVKGTSIQYGFATDASTGMTGQAAVTNVSGGNRAETKRIKGNDGDTMSYVIADPTIEVTAEVVCNSSADIPAVGAKIELTNFATAELNAEYYVTSSDSNQSNENEMTASLSLLRFTGSGSFTY